MRLKRPTGSSTTFAPTRGSSGFGYDLWGCRVGIEFPAVKLLDYAPHWQALEADANPFATVVLAHLKAQQKRRDADADTPAGPRHCCHCLPVRVSILVAIDVSRRRHLIRRINRDMPFFSSPGSHDGWRFSCLGASRDPPSLPHQPR